MIDFITSFWVNNSQIIRGLSYKFFITLIIVVLGLFGIKYLHRLIRKSNEKFKIFDETVIPVFKSIASIIVFSVCLLIVLDVFGVNTNSVLALFGAAGLAVALALKDTLSNIAAGIMLLVLRPFQTGHFIESGSISGTVKKIDLFTTILETADGLFVSVPNSVVWNSPIQNFTKNGRRRMDLVIGISYEDSIEKGFKVLMDIADNEPKFLKDPAPRVMIQELADSSVNIKLRAWTATDDFWDVYWDNSRKIKEKIEEAGITIPFPQRVVRISEK